MFWIKGKTIKPVSIFRPNYIWGGKKATSIKFPLLLIDKLNGSVFNPRYFVLHLAKSINIFFS